MQTGQSVSLAIDAKLLANGREIFVQGAFKVPLGKLSIPESGVDVLKHIIVVVTRYGNYQAYPPFKDVVVFEDDVRIDGDMCSGRFNFNVMSNLLFDGEGEYFVHCSIGQVISNTEKITIK